MPACAMMVRECSKGSGASTAFSINGLCDSDTVSPVFAKANACLRLAGVMRFAAPS